MRKIKGKEVISNLATRQCYFCDHFFATKEAFEKHIKICGHIAGITYKFNNRKIVPFQDDFKYMGDRVTDNKKCMSFAIVKYLSFIQP